MRELEIQDYLNLRVKRVSRVVVNEMCSFLKLAFVQNVNFKNRGGQFILYKDSSHLNFRPMVKDVVFMANDLRLIFCYLQDSLREKLNKRNCKDWRVKEELTKANLKARKFALQEIKEQRKAESKGIGYQPSLFSCQYAG